MLCARTPGSRAIARIDRGEDSPEKKSFAGCFPDVRSDAAAWSALRPACLRDGAAASFEVVFNAGTHVDAIRCAGRISREPRPSGNFAIRRRITSDFFASSYRE